MPVKYILIHRERANGLPQNPSLARQDSLDFRSSPIILGRSLRDSNLSYGLPGTCPACGGHFFAHSRASGQLWTLRAAPTCRFQNHLAGHTNGMTVDSRVSVAFVSSGKPKHRRLEAAEKNDASFAYSTPIHRSSSCKPAESINPAEFRQGLPFLLNFLRHADPILPSQRETVPRRMRISGVA